MQDTVVTFPAGAVTGRGRIEALLPLTEGVGVIVDRTPFHPVDHTWPDQPADRGTLAAAEVLDCVAGALGPDGQWRVGTDIEARRGDPEQTWAVVHVVADAPGAVGDEVDLAVDADLRAALSRGHSACHLAALALNEAAAGLWTKDAGRPDCLGHPDLDAMAITESRIEPDGAYDAYRLGKSVRRRGLDTAAVRAALPELQRAVDERLREWVAAGGTARIETDGDDRLTARRRWTASLPEGRAEIPCGGTHVSDLAELAGIRVRYEATEDGFEVRTSVG